MHKLNLILIFIFLVSLESCTYKDIERKYHQIVFTNGINKFEATAIADMIIMQSDYISYLDITEAELLDTEETKNYTKYWFVEYEPKLLFDQPSFLVIINKESGEVIFSDEYYPAKVKNNLMKIMETKKPQ